MRTVSKWGNSLALRIPAEAAASAGLVEGAEVEFRATSGRLIVEAVRPKYDLKTLVAGINRKNRPREIDWGKPRGKEIW